MEDNFFCATVWAMYPKAVQKTPNIIIHNQKVLFFGITKFSIGYWIKKENRDTLANCYTPKAVGLLFFTILSVNII